MTDLAQQKFILENLVGKNFKVMYRNMALGLLWSILNPLVLVIVLSVVWTLFFEAPEAFPAFVLVALIPFNFSNLCLSDCTQSVVNNASLVKKVAFPRQILPLSVIITHLVHFAIQSPLLVVVLLLFPPPGDVVGPSLLWLLPVLALHVVLVAAVGLLFAGMNVVYRDAQYIVESTLIVSFWICPILYDAHEVLSAGPQWMFALYYLNPLAGILEAYRSVLFYGTAPEMLTLGASAVVTALVAVFSVRCFWSHEREFANLL